MEARKALALSLKMLIKSREIVSVVQGQAKVVHISLSNRQKGSVPTGVGS